MRQRPKPHPSARVAAVAPETARRFTSVIASVAVNLDEIRHFHAKSLGISGPQFAILLTIQRLDQGEGISVRHVARALHVDSSFITTQSKLLEKKTLIRRRVDAADARVVNLSLSDKARRQIEGLAAAEADLNDFVFDGISDDALQQLTTSLDDLEQRLAKASLRIAAGL